MRATKAGHSTQCKVVETRQKGQIIARRDFLTHSLAALLLVGGSLDLLWSPQQVVAHAFSILPSGYQTGQEPIPPTYEVSSIGTTVVAKNITTGRIDFSGHDAATVIQSAVDNLTNGRISKERVILNGNFWISKTIRIPSYTILQIQGTLAPALRPVRDLNQLRQLEFDLIQNSDLANGNAAIEIMGGTFHGMNRDLSRNALSLMGVAKSSIHDVLITSFKDKGIVFTETTRHVTCDENTVSNCRFEHMGREAIRTIVPSTLPPSIGNRRNIVNACSFFSNNEEPGDHYGAIHLDANTQDCVVDQCTFTHEKSAVEIDSGFRNTVTNCTVDTTWSSAIIIYQGQRNDEQPSTSNIIRANTIRNAARAAILIASSGCATLAQYNTIQGNTIANCNTGASYPYGAIALEGSPRNVISDNTIDSCWQNGISLFPDDWRKCDSTQILRNSVSYCKDDGIDVGENAATDLTIQDNYCHDNEGYGILIQRNNYKTRILANQLLSNGLGPMSDQGVNTQSS